jgi:hypothetical protein
MWVNDARKSLGQRTKVAGNPDFVRDASSERVENVEIGP